MGAEASSDKARQRLARLSRYARRPTRARLLALVLEGDQLMDEVMERLPRLSEA